MPREPRSPSYIRRLESGIRRGLTKSQAYGHPRKGEPSARQMSSARKLEESWTPDARGDVMDFEGFEWDFEDSEY